MQEWICCNSVWFEYILIAYIKINYLAESFLDIEIQFADKLFEPLKLIRFMLGFYLYAASKFSTHSLASQK